MAFLCYLFFCVKQKTAYEMRISDWSSDVCSSDLPSAFDLAAIKTTASLVKTRGKPAFVIFTAGSPTAPRMYEEATQLVQDYGLDACPHRVADRAAFRHAAAEGKTAMEIEP